MILHAKHSLCDTHNIRVYVSSHFVFGISILDPLFRYSTYTLHLWPDPYSSWEIISYPVSPSLYSLHVAILYIYIPFLKGTVISYIWRRSRAGNALLPHILIFQIGLPPPQLIRSAESAMGWWAPSSRSRYNRRNAVPPPISRSPPQSQ
jgi:hypothetical protein